MATHFNILIWEILWTEESGRLSGAMESQESDMIQQLNNKMWSILQNVPCILRKNVCLVFLFNLFFKNAIVRLPRWLSDKESTCQCRRHRSHPWVQKIPWRRKLQPTPVFLSGKSHRQRSLAGYSPWGQLSDLAHTHARYIGSTSDHFWMKGFDCLVQKPQNEVSWHLCRGAGQPEEP